MMKLSRGIICVILLTKALSVNGQSDETSNALFSKIEIVGGRSLSYPIVSKEASKYRINKFGYAVNAGVRHSLNQNFSIVVRLGFEQKGIKSQTLSPPPASIIARIDETYNYMTFGGLSHYKIRQFYVGLGPYLGYIVNGRRQERVTENGVSRVQTDNKIEPSNYPRRFDVGLNLVLGYELPVGQKTAVLLQVAYGLGLVSMNESSQPKFLNNVLTVAGGLSFNRQSQP